MYAKLLSVDVMDGPYDITFPSTAVFWRSKISPKPAMPCANPATKKLYSDESTEELENN